MFKESQGLIQLGLSLSSVTMVKGAKSPGRASATSQKRLPLEGKPLRVPRQSRQFSPPPDRRRSGLYVAVADGYAGTSAKGHSSYFVSGEGHLSSSVSAKGLSSSSVAAEGHSSIPDSATGHTSSSSHLVTVPYSSEAAEGLALSTPGAGTVDVSRSHVPASSETLPHNLTPLRSVVVTWPVDAWIMTILALSYSAQVLTEKYTFSRDMRF